MSSSGGARLCAAMICDDNVNQQQPPHSLIKATGVTPLSAAPAITQRSPESPCCCRECTSSKISVIWKTKTKWNKIKNRGKHEKLFWTRWAELIYLKFKKSLATRLISDAPCCFGMQVIPQCHRHAKAAGLVPTLHGLRCHSAEGPSVSEKLAAAFSIESASWQHSTSARIYHCSLI